MEETEKYRQISQEEIEKYLENNKLTMHEKLLFSILQDTRDIVKKDAVQDERITNLKKKYEILEQLHQRCAAREAFRDLQGTIRLLKWCAAATPIVAGIVTAIINLI